jgi:hypothetical protein
MEEKIWFTQEETIDLIVEDAGMPLNREYVHGEILRCLESELGDAFYDAPEDFMIITGLVDKLRNHFKKWGYDSFKV